MVYFCHSGCYGPGFTTEQSPDISRSHRAVTDSFQSFQSSYRLFKDFTEQSPALFRFHRVVTEPLTGLHRVSQRRSRSSLGFTKSLPRPSPGVTEPFTGLPWVSHRRSRPSSEFTKPLLALLGLYRAVAGYV